MTRPMTKNAPVKCLVAAIGAVMLLFALAGCAGAPSSGSGGGGDTGGGGITDELFRDEVRNSKLLVFVLDGKAYTVDTFYEVSIPVNEPLQEGCFYKVVADVTYLNGGVAGYVNYPQVQRVAACVEVSPFDIGLPSIEDASYGLSLIGDYADGDVLLNERFAKAVWQDGEWIWRYDNEVDLRDGIRALICAGYLDVDVYQGIDDGILSCENYFILPAEGQR